MGESVYPDFRAKAGTSSVTSQVKLVPRSNQLSLLSPARGLLVQPQANTPRTSSVLALVMDR